jgi:hypothetical protein
MGDRASNSRSGGLNFAAADMKERSRKVKNLERSRKVKKKKRFPRFGRTAIA